MVSHVLCCAVPQVKPLAEDERARLKKAETAYIQPTNRPPRGFQQRLLNLGTRIGLWLVNSAGMCRQTDLLHTPMGNRLDTCAHRVGNFSRFS
jgi:hypothetical protein